MTFVDAWICKACWKPNRPQDPVCYRCKTPREADDAEVEARREAAAAKAAQPEVVPDIVVALPVVIFRGYSKAWLRSGFFVLAEVSDAMRNREVWAFVIGVGLSVVALIGTVIAFDVFAPGLVNPAGIRIGSLIVFGGAGVAAIAGLVMMYTRRERVA